VNSKGARERFASALEELREFSTACTGKTTDVRARALNNQLEYTLASLTDKAAKSTESSPNGWNVKAVLDEIGRAKSGAGINYRLYQAGEITRANAVEWITCAILNRRGEPFESWRRHAPVVEAALTHPLDCGCGECL
jgi:hypothetical protein